MTRRSNGWTRPPLSLLCGLLLLGSLPLGLANGQSQNGGANKAAVQPGEAPSATVTIEQYQVAFLFSGNLGGGKLQYQGKTYDFDIGGLGIGGIGASKITATGKVFHLNKLSDFQGAYGQLRYGLAVGDLSSGELWLQNAAGVIIGLAAEREGLALALGGDAIYIDLD